MSGGRECAQIGPKPVEFSIANERNIEILTGLNSVQVELGDIIFPIKGDCQMSPVFIGHQAIGAQQVHLVVLPVALKETGDATVVVDANGGDRGVTAVPERKRRDEIARSKGRIGACLVRVASDPKGAEDSTCS